MTRVDLCASDDELTLVELVMAIEELGGIAVDGDGSRVPGTGLNRYRFPTGELTVFMDAWSVDLAGPEKLVNDILAALKTGRD